MERVRLEVLEGNEVLAKHIVTETGFELMSAGTVLKRDYISRLKELGYEYIYIKEKEAEINLDQDLTVLRNEIREDSINRAKKIMNRHVYKNSKDVEELCEIAEGIVNDVLSNHQIEEELINIKRENADLYVHSISVCTLSTVMALRCDFSRRIVTDIAKGCILHDIGLKYTTVQYENTEVSLLSSAEQNEFRKHVINGYESVKEISWLSELSKNIILLHHERNDGSGYPFKNHCENMSEEIKIVMLCDAFDSLVSGIGFKKLKVYEAIEYVKVHTIDMFDESYVSLLLNMVALYPIGTKVFTNEGELALVIRQNNLYPERPVIRILADSQGNKIEDVFEKDLLEYLTLFITDTID